MSSNQNSNNNSSPQPYLSQADADRRLLGMSREPEYLSGIRRVENAALLYSSKVKDWPMCSQGQLIPQVNWGGQSLSINSANLHFIVAGVPGTGKTLAFRALIESIFGPDFRSQTHGSDRAILYDPKQEFLPILDGMGVSANDVILLNPFDRRSYCWDIACDYTDPASAVQLAKTIIPCGDNLSQPFFPKASAAILAAVICEHMKINPGSWDLADIIFDCLSEERLLQRIQSAKPSPYNYAALTSLAKGDTRASILAELSTGLSEYLPLAACWRKAREERRRFSIRQFIASQSTIAVLGANRTYSETLSAMNRLFLRRFSELSLDNTDDTLWKSGNRTWLFLDELKELGKVHDLASFISKGRSKGLCTVLGFQDFSGLKEAFGEHNANEITSCCHHKIYLRLSGESAEWASKNIGQTEVLDVSVSVRSGNSIAASFNSGVSDTKGKSVATIGGFFGTFNTPFGSNSESRATQSGAAFTTTLSNDVTVSKQAKVKDAVLASEISGLPDFVKGRGITGFTCDYCEESQTSVVRRLHLPVEKLEFLNRKNSVPGFVPWKTGELEW